MHTCNYVHVQMYMCIHVHTYFACRVSAATPDIKGVEALVPVKSSVHLPFRVVVV